MKRLVLAMGLGATLVLALATARTSAEDPSPEPTISPKEITAGMKGYGLTVVSGEKPERFNVEAISVVENEFYKEDIILIRLTDARFEHLGVMHGMSGSPVYFPKDGKDCLAGALAYGFSSFPKDPIAGVTPIDYMIKMAKAPERPRASVPRTVDARRAIQGLRGPWRASESAPLEAPREGEGTRLVPLGLPIVYSGGSTGLGERLRAFFARRGRPCFPIPAGGDGGGDATTKDTLAALEPGAAVGIQLVRGDLALSTVGTLTTRDGDRFTGFGHPMEGEYGAGPLELPVVLAKVQCCFADLTASFKLATPVAPAGTLVSDEQFGFVAKRALYPKDGWVPVTTVVRDGKSERTFHSEVVRDRRYLGLIDSGVVSDAVAAGATRSEDCVSEVKLKVVLGKDRAPLEVSYVEQRSGEPYGPLEPLGRIVELLDRNPIAPVTIASVEVEVTVKAGRESGEVEAAWAQDAPVRPGEKALVHVRFRPYRKDSVVRAYEVTVPATLEDGTATLEVDAGEDAPHDVPTPEKVDDLLEQIRKRFAIGSREVVFAWSVPGDEVHVRGRALADLPPGAARLLADSSHEKATRVVHHVLSREATPWVLSGKAECHVSVDRSVVRKTPPK